MISVLVLAALVAVPRLIAALQNQSVLLTGASGFIGSQLQKHLLGKGVTVLGLDKFDVYYSVPLKWSRVEDSHLLSGAEVVAGDVCDGKLLHTLLRKHSFTHIVHLAAQAGVRDSINHPLKYIRDNIECFTILMEEIRLYGDEYGQQAMPKLVYASSSSVYGANSKIPFAEIDPVEEPSNVYGATKLMDELLAYTYYNLYGVRSIGLRFFTVYGPWDRPDMAAWKFSEQILRNETITVYNQGRMKRGFTFVTDIVRGIAACLDLEHTEPEVFNLGNNKPVETMYFLELVEKSVGRKARVRFEDSKAEIAVSYANVTHANEKLGFKASTSIEEGLQKFAEWFRSRQVKTYQCESGCALDSAFAEAGAIGPSMCGVSAWAEAAAKSRTVTEGCETVIYTFLSHLKHRVESPALNSELPAHCHVAYLAVNGGHEDHSVVVKGWTAVTVTVKVPAEASVFTEYASIPRMAPWRLFAPSVRYAVGHDSRRALAMTVKQLLSLLQSSVPATGTDAPRKASVLMLRNARASNLYDEASLSASTGRQVAAYRQQQERDQLSYDNVFDPDLVVFDLHDEVARSFSCEWYREAQEWHPHGGSGQVAGSYVLARRWKEIAERTKSALPLSGADASAAENTARVEWLPVSAVKGPPARVGYVRLLSSDVPVFVRAH
jgi:UDP-glucuronate 4-epimerase